MEWAEEGEVRKVGLGEGREEGAEEDEAKVPVVIDSSAQVVSTFTANSAPARTSA